MRDYRDAKAMAQTARAFLADHGVKITNSQSLELIAKAFGVADWNTLAAAIRGEVTAPRTKVATAPATVDAGIRPRAPRFFTELELTLQRAFGYGDARKHQYTTLEWASSRSPGNQAFEVAKRIRAQFHEANAGPTKAAKPASGCSARSRQEGLNSVHFQPLIAQCVSDRNNQVAAKIVRGFAVLVLDWW